MKDRNPTYPSTEAKENAAALPQTEEKLNDGQKKERRLLTLLIPAVLLAAAIFAGVLLWPKPAAATPDVTPTPPAQAELPAWAPYASAALKEAYEKNPDTAGWLTVEGCDIDDPVMQAADNDKYLRRTEFDDAYDVWGCYFLDYINVNDGETLPDRVSIIYGHSLDDVIESEKFSKLKRYTDNEFAAAHPTFTFSLRYAAQEYRVVAVCRIPVSMDYIDPAPGDEKYQKLLDYLEENSSYDFGYPLSLSDKLLVLSTCTADENTRFIVAAVAAE